MVVPLSANKNNWFAKLHIAGVLDKGAPFALAGAAISLDRF
jgi:hypothetical protein